MSWSVVAKHYLMESLGNLLWVRRFISSHVDDMANMVYDEEVEFPHRTYGFDVYRLDFARNTWEYTKCVGDQVLFLGINQSLSLPAREVPGFKANNIYFTDDSRSIHYGSYRYGGYDLGRYDLGRVTTTSDFSHDYEKVLPPHIWVMPKLK